MDGLNTTEVRTAIEGVRILPLRQIADDRGAVLHMIRSDSPIFREFGEIYFSEVNPGVVKAWKRHKRMTQLFAVPHGRIRMAVYDDREDSASRFVVEEIIMGRPDQYNLVRIPPMLWYGFQGIGETPSLLANCADLLHDPAEADTLDISDPHIPFQWAS